MTSFVRSAEVRNNSCGYYLSNSSTVFTENAVNMDFSSSAASDSENTRSYADVVKGNDGNLWKRFQVEDVEEATRIALEASLEDIHQVDIFMILLFAVCCYSKGTKFQDV